MQGGVAAVMPYPVRLGTVDASPIAPDLRTSSETGWTRFMPVSTEAGALTSVIGEEGLAGKWIRIRLGGQGRGRTSVFQFAPVLHGHDPAIHEVVSFQPYDAAIVSAEVILNNIQSPRHAIWPGRSQVDPFGFDQA